MTLPFPAWRTDLLARFDASGPIDLFVTFEEYRDRLIPLARRLWNEPGSWTPLDRKFFLAFLRGYTFYRELSEDEDQFWANFHQELGLTHDAPTAKQYDALWKALQVHAAPFCIVMGGRERVRREFVKTIDAVWGIASLRASQLRTLFRAYYEERNGEVVTASVIRQLLPDAADSIQRQAAAYDRVFRGMARCLDFILDQDLPVEDLNPRDLSRQLRDAGVDLGDPDPITFFCNKSPTAVRELVAALRTQRTPGQFRRYLASIPHHRIERPDGKPSYARDLMRQEVLECGRYLDLDGPRDGQSRPSALSVVPAASLSLQRLAQALPDRFEIIAGLVIYSSWSPFTAVVDNDEQAALPLRVPGDRSPRFVWAGRVPPGTPVRVGQRRFGGSRGCSAVAYARLQLDPAGRVSGLEAVLERLRLYEPDADSPVALRFGPLTRAVVPDGRAETLNVALDPDEGMEAWLGEFQWSWPGGAARLFLPGGREVVRSRLPLGPAAYLLLSRADPVVSAGVGRQPLPHPFGSRWRVHSLSWDGVDPLEIAAGGRSWRVERRFETSLRSPAPRQEGEAQLGLAPGYFEAGPVHLDLLDLPSGMQLDALISRPDGWARRLPVVSTTLQLGELPAGRYRVQLLLANEPVSEGFDLRVLPKLSWTFTRRAGPIVEGQWQAGEVRLPDGRFGTFRWRPAWTPVERESGTDWVPEPVPLRAVLDQDEDLDV
ncbi:MAG TPA: hypothetical protein VHN99_04555, partial [Deinococcales bacterium]|nr:hypothetical protein [Deinococcales bacterium]